MLYTEERLRAAAAGLRIDTLTEVYRTIPDGTAIDLLLVAAADSRGIN